MSTDTESEKKLGAYQNMESGEKNIKPEFLKEGKDGKSNNSAANKLKRNEDEAANNLDKSNVREKEKTGGFASNVIGKDAKNGKKKGGIKGILKGKGPLGLIVGLVFGGGALFTGMQGLQFTAWFQNVNALFGQSSAILNIRTGTVLNKMFTTNTSVTRTDIFGHEKYKIKPDSKMGRKLKANNIDVVETTDADGNKLKMLVYNDSDGSKIPIVASDSDIQRVPTGKIDVDGVEVELTKSPVTLSDAKTKIKNFSTDFDTATLTLTGKIAGWFDSLSDILLRRIGGDDARNPFKKVKDKSDADEVEDALFKNAGDGADDSDISGVRRKTDESDPDDAPKVTDDDISDVMKKTGNVDGDSDGTLKVGNVDTNSVAESKLKARIAKAAIGANVVCMVLRGIGAINAVIGAAQLSNSISLALKYLSLVNQVMAGDGDETFHIAANAANTSTETVAYDKNGREVKLEGAMTDSDGFNNVFSDKNIISADDPGALMVNREYATQVALRSVDWGGGGQLGEDVRIVVAKLGSSLGSFATSVKAFTICNGIQAAMGLADFIGDAVLFLTTAGIGNALKEFAEGIWNSAKVAAAIGALGLTIALLAPVVGQWFAGNLKPVFMSRVGGFALDSGTHATYNGNTQIMSGKNDTKEEAIELYGRTREVEKEWIAYDRATLSPFDVSSKYTFMGSLVSSSMPILGSLNKSLTSIISSSANVVGQSIISLSGATVSAANDIDNFRLSLGDEDSCPNLSGMGIAGDAYCNRYSGAYINDLENLSSGEIYDKIKDSFDGVDEDGNPKIKPKSDYAKYILACNTNDAQPGTMSAVVQGYVSGAYDTISGGSTIGSTLLSIGSGFIPFEGAVDIFSSAEEQANVKWNSQAVCSDPEYRYYSSYGVDQRVLEGLGVIEKSAVTAFLEDYYEENPLDNSYEGVLARYSGMTKEQVSDTLALIEYVEYIANYDPSERYAFGDSGIIRPLIFDNENTMAIDGMRPLEKIVYADVRNRNFVV